MGMTTLLISGAILVFLITAYLLVLRPWQLHWGATRGEVDLALPGDAMVAAPDFNATRAITIASSPALVWRWLIQIGSKRAGWYSIDWIDNGGVSSASNIIPEFQKIEPGQFIPFTPNQKNGMWVKEFEEFRYILWTDKARGATWLWYLVPTVGGEVRLLTRLRTRYKWKGLWILYYLLYDVGDIIMMRACLKGIRQRAEREKAAQSTVF